MSDEGRPHVDAETLIRRTEAVLGAGGTMARAVAGFTPREGQLEAARAVAQAVADDARLLLEAGTGIGKTFAYLVPALLSGRRVMVSTGTLTLQDQIARSDLPALARALAPATIDAVVLKGRSNYACKLRFEAADATVRASLAGADAVWLRLRAWMGETTTGDFGELAGSTQGLDLPSLSAARDTCVGKTCPHYDDCFVVRLRERARRANVVVVNHHLFLADTAVRDESFGGFLPDADVVILDEAHKFEGIAQDFLSAELSRAKLAGLGADLTRLLKLTNLQGTERINALERAYEAMSKVADLFFAGFFAAAGDGSRRRLSPARLPAGALEWKDALAARLEELGTAVSAVLVPALPDEQRDQGRNLAHRAREYAQTLVFLLTLDDDDWVLWSESRNNNVRLAASPLDPGPHLAREVWGRSERAYVLASATLSAGGDLNFVRARLGLPAETPAVSIASPFDYAGRVRLYLPPHLGDPRAPGYLEAVADETEAVVHLTGGGVLVLFTAFEAMYATARRLRERLSQTVLVQGEAARAHTLERFRGDIDSVLCATASFWEGVDVPGDALRAVVIDRIPFDPPGDPIIEATVERLTARGLNPFAAYQLPRAALLLKQGAGRLMRRTTDGGLIAVLDGRLTSKPYGRLLRRALPPAPVLRTRDDIARFWAERPR